MSDLPTGIAKLPNGHYRVRIAYGTRNRGMVQKEKTFPADAGLKEMKEWQSDTRADLKRLNLRPAKGTLKADAPRYHERFTQRLDHPESRKAELAAWFPTFGQRARHTIKSAEVRQQVKDWQAAGVAASTIRHRLTALSTLYQELDGEEAYNPVKGVKRPPEPVAQPDFRSPETILSVLDAMANRVARNNRGWETLARALCLTYTGTRPSQLMRVDLANHLLLDQTPPMVFIPAGKRGKAHWKPLTAGGVMAFRLLVNSQGGGAFSTSAFYKSWIKACKDADVTPFNPYKLRHSYATLLRRGGMDLADVQQLLGHTNAKTTSRYAAVIPEKLTASVEAFEKGWKNRDRLHVREPLPPVEGASAQPESDAVAPHPHVRGSVA